MSATALVDGSHLEIGGGHYVTLMTPVTSFVRYAVGGAGLVEFAAGPPTFGPRARTFGDASFDEPETLESDGAKVTLSEGRAESFQSGQTLVSWAGRHGSVYTLLPVARREALDLINEVDFIDSPDGSSIEVGSSFEPVEGVDAAFEIYELGLVSAERRTTSKLRKPVKAGTRTSGGEVYLQPFDDRSDNVNPKRIFEALLYTSSAVAVFQIPHDIDEQISVRSLQDVTIDWHQS